MRNLIFEFVNCIVLIQILYQNIFITHKLYLLKLLEYYYYNIIRNLLEYVPNYVPIFIKCKLDILLNI